MSNYERQKRNQRDARRDFIRTMAKHDLPLPLHVTLDDWHVDEHAGYYLRRAIEVLNSPAQVAAFLDDAKFEFYRENDRATLALSPELRDKASEGFEYWLDNFYSSSPPVASVPYGIYDLNEKASIRVAELFLSLDESQTEKWYYDNTSAVSISGLPNLPQTYKDACLLKAPLKEEVNHTSENFSDEALRQVAKSILIAADEVPYGALANPYLTEEFFNHYFRPVKRYSDPRQQVLTNWLNLHKAEIPPERIHKILQKGQRDWPGQVSLILCEFMYSSHLSLEDKEELIELYGAKGTKSVFLGIDNKEDTELIVFPPIVEAFLLGQIPHVADSARLEEILYDERLARRTSESCEAILANPYCSRSLILAIGKTLERDDLMQGALTAGYKEPNPVQYVNQFKFYKLLSDTEKEGFTQGVNEQLALAGLPVSDSPLSIKMELLSLVIEDLVS